MKISENSLFSSVAKTPRKPRNPMSIKIDIPQPELLKPKITIFGVGGAGGNALNNMIRSNLEGVEFVAANTDAQALSNSLAQYRIQLGIKTTRGLGAGSFPDRGKIAAEENIAEIEKYLEGCNMVFIAAGMGGGTGTGAAPVIAKLARERDILTVGVITKPFHFEGKYRMETAESGIEELKKYVDTLIVIPNQNLFRIANESTTFESAFKMADDVLHAGVRGVTDLITMPGLVNLDFADIRTIMTKMGKAMMGTGEATGENRAILACEAAISNPLLDDISIKGAKGVLVNMTGGPDMTLFEADMAVNSIRKEVDPSANIIFGSAFNEDMKGKIRISVVATGIDSDDIRREPVKNEATEPSRFRVSLGNNSENKTTFFDPGIAAKLSEKHLAEEISEINFKSKNTVFNHEENSGYGALKSGESRLKISEHHTENDSDDDFIDEKYHEKPSREQESQEQSSFFSFRDSEKIEEELATKKPSSSRTAKSTNKSKKESGGFSLFSFMNSGKAKESEEEKHLKAQKSGQKVFDDEFEDDGFADDFSALPSESEQKNHGSRRNNHELKQNRENIAKQKRKEFFGRTVFDEEAIVDTDHSVDDDIINIPAFFRKKG